jgi:hypothetical protein
MTARPAEDTLRHRITLAAAVLGSLPVLMFGLLAITDGGLEYPWLPVLVAAPVTLAGAALAVAGTIVREPRRSVPLSSAAVLLLVTGVALVILLREALI